METELLGLSVNSETGEVKHISKDIMIKYENAFTLNKEKPFIYPLKKKYRKQNKMLIKN